MSLRRDLLTLEYEVSDTNWVFELYDHQLTRRRIDFRDPKRYISSVIWPTSICSIMDSSSIVRSDYRDGLDIYPHNNA